MRGIHLEVPQASRTFRFDKLVTREANGSGIREIYRGQYYGGDRRFLALDGLRLAYELLQPRVNLLYSARHTIFTDEGDARTGAFPGVERDVRSLRNGTDPNAPVTTAQLRTVDDALALATGMTLVNDVYSAGLIVELRPTWQCAPDITGSCIESLNLPQALTQDSFDKLSSLLDLR